MEYQFYNTFGYLLVIIAGVITIAAEYLVQSRYQTYQKGSIQKKLTGQEVARIILDKHGLNDVYVTEVQGTLTDHYDPNRRVVRLSTAVFHGDSIASISVAAHECGHAVQHKEGYLLIKIRGLIFPLVSFASRFGYLAIMIGFLFGAMDFAWAGVGLLLVILLFQLITLPVEFNASKRALQEIQEEKIVTSEELEGSKKMLIAAALTYVAGLATTILEILRFVLLIIARDDRN